MTSSIWANLTRRVQFGQNTAPKTSFLRRLRPQKTRASAFTPTRCSTINSARMKKKKPRPNRSNPDNRNEALGDFETVKVWTHFTFPGRQGKYSEMQWHWHHFTAIDYNAYAAEDAPNAIYLFKGASFDQNVDLEKGNFDYLMGCDLNMEHPEVVGELDHWGEWFTDLTGVDGFRFDAVKHVGANFFSGVAGPFTGKNRERLFCRRRVLVV